MSIFKPEYDTYQDVRTTLTWWSVPAWLVMVVTICFGVVPPDFRASLKTYFPEMWDWVDRTGSLVVAFGLAVVLSQFLIHVVEIHDRVYDRYVVRWRSTFDCEFILPRLLEGYPEHMSSALLSLGSAHREELMERLFYPFVRDRDTKVQKNVLVRFYEVITKYWLSQLIEVASIITAVVNVIVLVTEGLARRPFRPALIWILLACVLCWAGARLVALRVRKRVEGRTEAEIADIRGSYQKDFESALQSVCRKFKIPIETPKSTA